MASPRGSSEATKSAILKAARELFAERGIYAVTVREVAARAGVNHALVHRYFGAKSDMIAEIMRREIGSAAQTIAPEFPDTQTSLAMVRRLLEGFLTDGRTTLQLIMRAELAGLEPEGMLEGNARLLKLLSEWIADQQAVKDGAGGALDPALVSAVVGAAVLGFANAGPFVTTAVGLTPDTYETRQAELVDALTTFVAIAAGVEPPRASTSE